ncbi:hypothetical protein ACQY0O_000088 [Thecaphora frezii]
MLSICARSGQHIIDDVCATLERCIASLSEASSLETFAQIEVHFRDRPRMLREQRRALVRRCKGHLAEQGARDESSIQVERTLELLYQLALL